ncbi:unnamed protein product [marine sediment metagenome]|uniref:Uncharacterized protein n=1 Tax=marine sediment metagenome TaxID=412755 RepID=X1QBU1_9ZZZZ
MKVNLVLSRKGIVGEGIVIKPKKLETKIALPQKIERIILFRDLNFFRSSINPIAPALITVIRKIIDSFSKAGKKNIRKIKAIVNPITKATPPDSATSG